MRKQLQRQSSLLIALGANMQSEVGPPEATLRHALDAMPQAGLAIRAESPFYATPCFPAGAGPDYVNAAVRVTARMDAPSVLALLHDIEQQYGRERAVRWGQRTLDLDLIAFDDLILPDHETHTRWRQMTAADQQVNAPQQLILPHPRVQDRAFVLVPLKDVAPQWQHPVLGLKIDEMIEALPTSAVSEVKPL